MIESDGGAARRTLLATVLEGHCLRLPVATPCAVDHRNATGRHRQASSNVPPASPRESPLETEKVGPNMRSSAKRIRPLPHSARAQAPVATAPRCARVTAAKPG